jgi:hypothetical protein
MIKYKEKLERIMGKHKSELEVNLKEQQLSEAAVGYV